MHRLPYWDQDVLGQPRCPTDVLSRTVDATKVENAVEQNFVKAAADMHAYRVAKHPKHGRFTRSISQSCSRLQLRLKAWPV